MDKVTVRVFIDEIVVNEISFTLTTLYLTFKFSHMWVKITQKERLWYHVCSCSSKMHKNAFIQKKIRKSRCSMQAHGVKLPNTSSVYGYTKVLANLNSKKI